MTTGAPNKTVDSVANSVIVSYIASMFPNLGKLRIGSVLAQHHRVMVYPVTLNSHHHQCRRVMDASTLPGGQLFSGFVSSHLIFQLGELKRVASCFIHHIWDTVTNQRYIIPARSIMKPTCTNSSNQQLPRIFHQAGQDAKFVFREWCNFPAAWCFIFWPLRLWVLAVCQWMTAPWLSDSLGWGNP